MAVYGIVLRHGSRTDPNATIGYDQSIETYFLLGFEVMIDGAIEPEIWLGRCLWEFPTFDALIQAARQRGYEISKLSQPAENRLRTEAGQKSATIFERWLKIFS